MRQLAQMRSAKAAKRRANPPEQEPRIVRWNPLELGLRDRMSGEVAWVEFKSIRDAIRRLSVVQKFYLNRN